MRKEYHHSIYWGLLMLIALFLPTSKYMTSFAQILLVIHWIFRGQLIKRIKIGVQNKALWVFLLVFLVHLVGMLYSENQVYGWHDLQIKLPLFVIPIVLSSSEKLTKKETQFILLTFVAAVCFASLFSVAALLGWFQDPVLDYRDASRFISHIRFALMVVLSLFILWYYSFDRKLMKGVRFLFVGISLYLLAFLILSKAMTGIIIVLAVGMILGVRWVMKNTNFMAKWFAIVGLLTIPVLVSTYLSGEWNRFHTPKESFDRVDKQTIQGNNYWHDTTNLSLENGYRVGYYWCEKEMRESWSARSSISYDGKDLKGHDLKFTLARYLTSCGYRKDAYGISRLEEEDINLIENGFANVNHRNKNRFSNRIYEIIWQIDAYRKGGNPSGHSITQRIEYVKTGWSIFLDNFWFGVGTGDVQDEFEREYVSSDSQLESKWQNRAHNQWLTFAIALGFFGFVIMLTAFVLPGILEKGFQRYFFIVIFLITLLSMINEDTLETQAGVAFVAYFYSLFLFGLKKEKTYEKA